MAIASRRKRNAVSQDRCRSSRKFNGGDMAVSSVKNEAGGTAEFSFDTIQGDGDIDFPNDDEQLAMNAFSLTDDTNDDTTAAANSESKKVGGGKKHAPPPNYLWLFVQQQTEPSLYSVEQLRSKASVADFSLCQQLRDQVRVNHIRASTGARVFTACTHASDHPDHADFLLSSDVNLRNRGLPDHFCSISQVAADIVWMQTGYYRAYGDSFFTSFVPSLSQHRLTVNATIHLPATPQILEQILSSKVILKCFHLRFLTLEQTLNENVLAKAGEELLTVDKVFGKHPPSYYYERLCGLTLKDARAIGAPPALLTFHPGSFSASGNEPQVVSLVLSKIRGAPPQLQPSEFTSTYRFAHLRPITEAKRKVVVDVPDNVPKKKAAIKSPKEKKKEVEGDSSEDEWILDVDGKSDRKSSSSNAQALERMKAKTRLTFERFMSMDVGGPRPGRFPYLVLLPPKNQLGQSSQSVLKMLDLSSSTAMKKSFTGKILAVEKSEVQIVGCYQLHVVPHGVLGSDGLQGLASHLKFEVDFLKNDVNHPFREDSPDRPVVVNRYDTPGLEQSQAALDLGFALEDFFSLDLLSQYRLEVMHGIDQGYLDEIIMHAKIDSRGLKFLTAHYGLAVRVATGWTRVGGVSVAMPGNYPSTLGASDGCRKWLARINSLLTHAFIKATLTGTSREQQGDMTDEEKKVAAAFFDEFLRLPETAKKQLRLSPGMTAGIGESNIHLDSLNPSNLRQDQNNSGIVYIDDLSKLLKGETIEHLRSNTALNLCNNLLIFLCYGREIVISQAVKLSLPDNPFMREMAQAADSEYDLSISVLDKPAFLKRFTGYALQNKTIDESPLNYSSCLEGGDRNLFLGTIAYCWFQFVDKYNVKWRHFDEFVAVIAREFNGVPLVVSTFHFLVDTDRGKQLVESEFHVDDCPGRLYRLVCIGSKRQKDDNAQLKGVSSSTDPRWTTNTTSLYNGEESEEEKKTIRNFVGFISSELSRLRCPNDTREYKLNVCLMFVSALARKESNRYDATVLRSVELGPVRGTVAVQLAGFIQSAPAEFSSWARIEKPSSKKSKNGFYQFVNHVMKTDRPGRSEDMSTEECLDLCMDTIRHLGPSRRIDMAFLDQNSCRASRMMFSTRTYVDGRKKDFLYYHKTTGQETEEMAFCPIHSKVAEVVEGGLTTRTIRFWVLDCYYDLSEYLDPVPFLNSRLDEPASKNQNWGAEGLVAFRRSKLYKSGSLISII